MVEFHFNAPPAVAKYHTSGKASLYVRNVYDRHGNVEEYNENRGVVAQVKDELQNVDFRGESKDSKCNSRD